MTAANVLFSAGVPSTLVWSVRLLAALGGLAMASTGECEMLFLLVFLSFFLLGIKIEDLPVLRRFMGVAQPFLAALVFLISLIDFFFLSNSFLLSVAHFLLCLQGLQLLVLRTARENLGGVLISSLMILSASTLAVEWTFFVMLCLYLPALIWTLMLHTIITDAAASGNEEGAIPTLRLEPQSLLWRRMMPVLRNSSLAAFTVAMLCCALIFVVFPRFNFRGFRGQFLQPVQRTGFTNQVDLVKSGKIYSDDSIVVRVEIDEGERRKWPGYLRGSTLEVFDGRLWKRAPYSVDRVYQVSRGEFHIPIRGEPVGERLKQSIYLESMDSPILFSVFRPAVVNIDRPTIEVLPDGSIQRTWGDSWRIHYEVESFLPPSQPTVGKRESSASVRKVQGGNYSLTLPDPPLDRIQKLSDEVAGNSKDPFEIAENVKTYLSKNFEYTLDNTPAKKDQNPLEYFLFETKRGHCEFFASAMCLMLRYQGIPARIATGFYSHEWNEQGHYYVVRMKNAHAWVEAYVEPYGWVSFDPSPRLDERGLRTSAAVRRLRETWDYLNLRWNRYILSYDFERQKSILESVTTRSSEISARLGNLGSGFRRRVIRIKSLRLEFFKPALENMNWFKKGMVGIFAASIVVLAYFFRLKIQRGRFHKHAWLFKRLIRALEKQGGPKHPSKTLKEFSDSLRDRLGKKNADVQFLQERYYYLRFHPSAFLNKEEEQAIHAALERLQ